MQEIPPSTLTPFVFSDPAGKRWPRLRLVLLIFGVLAFLGSVLFVQTLFVAPQMRVPFSLRQCVHQTVKIFAVSAAEKRLDLSVRVGDAVPDRLVGDPDRLRQILLNLAGNFRFVVLGGQWSAGGRGKG